ncbi:hypothetical protein LTR15_011910 [Elasticomyces elasticus]|nr:hypothetical protein LTR15_011910 [Elasticomyces elasticus]
MAAASEKEAYAAAVRAAEHEHYEALLGGVRNASSELEQLKMAHKQLHAAFRLDGVDSNTVQSTLDSMGEAAAAMSRLLTACTEHRMEVWKPTEKSAQSAQRVFGIPELCELICTYLVRGQDLLHASQVNRATAAVARGSSSIQRVLGFAPDRSGFWHSPFAPNQFLAFECDVTLPYSRTSIGQAPGLPMVTACFTKSGPSYLAYYEYDPNDDYGYDYDCNSDYGNVLKLPRLGSAFRDVLICSPPIKEMHIRPSCCPDEGYLPPSETGSIYPGDLQPPPPQPIKLLSNSNGITVGDVYDATVSAREEHRLCPFASPYNLDGAGVAHPRIVFEGTMQLAEYDPLLVARREAMAEATKPLPVECDPLSTKMNALIETMMRTRASRLGRSIPTLAEYTASKALWTALEESEIKKVNARTSPTWDDSWSNPGWVSARGSEADVDENSWGNQGHWAEASAEPASNALQPGVSYAAMASRGLN